MTPVPSGIDRRIFVVGCPRSGTTLVQSLLASHSTMTSFTESHFFWRHFRRVPLASGAILVADPAPRVRTFLAENTEEPPDAARWFETSGAWALRVKALRPFQTNRVARQLLNVLDELAVRRGRAAWIEKTPKHLRYVPFLERVSAPERATHFVHVIRGGLETVVSLRDVSRAWEQPYGLEACVERWNEDVSFSLARVPAPNDHFVFYEELTARPEDVLGPLLGALGLSWEPGILERYSHTARQLTTADEPWKVGLGRSISPSATSPRTLTDGERRRVGQRLRAGLYEQLRSRVRQRAEAAA